jgi:hypothetical protein
VKSCSIPRFTDSTSLGDRDTPRPFEQRDKIITESDVTRSAASSVYAKIVHLEAYDHQHGKALGIIPSPNRASIRPDQSGLAAGKEGSAKRATSPAPTLADVRLSRSVAGALAPRAILADNAVWDAIAL